MVTEQQAETAILTLQRWINAAENSNQHGEDMVVAAAAGPVLLDALSSAECAVEQLCIGQDPANQCWVTLAEIRAAIAKATGK